jgi:hypothetical protein
MLAKCLLAECVLARRLLAKCLSAKLLSPKCMHVGHVGQTFRWPNVCQPNVLQSNANLIYV